MVRFLRRVIGALVLIVPISACANTVSSLCDTLLEISDGEVRHVTLRGILLAEPELSVLYDPAARRCGDAAQPAIWVEMTSTAATDELKRILTKDGRALVIVEGEIYGPGKALHDLPELEPQIAAAIRIGKRRYGHMGEFRTKIVVQRVLTVTAAPESLPREYVWRQAVSGCQPRVVNNPGPRYPKLARLGGVTGDVIIRYEVVAGNVRKAEATSGDRMFRDEAVAFIKTLKFEQNVTATLECRILFELERRSCQEGTNPKVELLLPSYVRVVGARHMW